MLGRISSRLLSGSGAWVRHLSTTGRVLEGQVASNKSTKEYASEIEGITNMEPSFTSDFLKNANVRPRDGPTPSKIKLSVFAPHKIFMNDREVDMALIPAISGDFGVMAGHVPIVAQLRPGVVAVHNTLDKDVERYFVSGGFAVAHADSSVEVTVVEAANVEDLDPAAVKTGLAEYTARCYFARFSGAGSSE